MTASTPEGNDARLFDLMERKLFTAVLCDVMDTMGYRNQAMSEVIRPLEPKFVFAGRAKTILAADIYHVPEEPYKLEIAAMDSILPNDIVMVGTGNSRRSGFWGELLSTAARARGARGAVMDGLVRDVRQIVELGFPVFAAGIKPVDSKGRGLVVGYDCPIQCGGVAVHPGDVVMADYDGVAVIPKAIVKEAVEAALEKVEKEDKTRDELAKGAYLGDVFKRHGVL